MPRNALLPLLLLTSALMLPHASARAQVKHCVASDGTRIYTDRKCEALGASAYVEPSVSSGTSFGRPNACARSVQDLAYALDEAIRSGDANRIAGLYDWAGTGTANGYRLMDRLETIAERPLVDVQPLYAGDADPYGYPFSMDGPADAATRKPQLIGLRVEQTLRNGSTPARAVFGLRRRLGCWWVRL